MNNKKKRIIIIILALLMLYGLRLFWEKKGIGEQVDVKDEIETSFKEEENISQKESEIIKVHIIGEVNQPGLIELEEGSRIYDAIQLAGGLTDEADTSKTNLAYILSDGEKIYIPNKSDNNESIQNLVENKKVNINLADVSELMTVPGIGESTANSIVEYRMKNRKIYVN